MLASKQSITMIIISNKVRKYQLVQRARAFIISGFLMKFLMDNEITDLLSRSFWDNILIHNYNYTPSKDQAATLQEI